MNPGAQRLGGLWTTRRTLSRSSQRRFWWVPPVPQVRADLAADVQKRWRTATNETRTETGTARLLVVGGGCQHMRFIPKRGVRSGLGAALAPRGPSPSIPTRVGAAACH